MNEPRANELGGDTAPEPSRDAFAPTSQEQWGSRLIRDTAARAAALRDTWDRSYSAARTGAVASPAERLDPAPAGPDPLMELIAEQQRTNALLSEVLAELRRRR
jgi:hypothetical protein